MDTTQWSKARLIPISGLRAAAEQETRATSALLAVMTIVPDFGRSLLREVGAPAGRLSAYTEVTFDDGDSGQIRPDGVVQMTRGSKRWSAVIEVKTGRNRLGREQVESYVRLANREGIDAVITLSNTFVAPSAPHPVALRASVLKKVNLFHWSWTHVLTTAVILRDRHGVSDPEQAWILDELIRYLEDERSGALDFEGLGPSWVAVRDAARTGTLRPGDNGLDEIANRWDQFLRSLCLHLGRDLGADVEMVVGREHLRDPVKRSRDMSATLGTEYLLQGVLRVPDAAGDIQVEADLRSRRITASIDIEPPSTGQPATRINWLVKQLKTAPDEVQVGAKFRRRRSTSELLAAARGNPKHLLNPKDSKESPRWVTAALARDMGIKGGRGRGSFVSAMEDLVRDFYHDVVQDLKTYVKPAPRIVAEPDSQIEQDVGEGATTPVQASWLRRHPWAGSETRCDMARLGGE
jgi:hypothetical protein